MLDQTVTLTRAEFDSLLSDRTRLKRLDSELEGTNLSLELLLGQVVPTLRLLTPEGVTLAQAIESGRSFYIPKKPMTVDAVFQGLFPIILANSCGQYADNFSRRCEPFRARFQGRMIHAASPESMEQLLRDVEEGQFLTDADKKRILLRNRWTAPLVKDGREKWYSDKSLVHSYGAWRRLLIRASAIGAWPTLRPLPTEVMEKPRADVPELETICPDDWEILVSAVNKHQLRFVALLISDIRPAEIDRLEPDHIAEDARHVPDYVNVPPIYTKGKKGSRKGRTVQLLPNARVMLYLAKAQGDKLFPMNAEDMQESIYARARELGIETGHNFIRRFHDTYWYALVQREGCNQDSSHDKRLIERYRDIASFHDAVRVYSTLPTDTPPYLRKWVLNWVNRFREAVGGPEMPPAPSPDPPIAREDVAISARTPS
jgi:hypothetical protein